MGDIPTQLEGEYCPPLDPALLSAILSDYELENESQVKEAKLLLDQLKESALLEEQLGFDASGTGGAEDRAPHCSRPESCPEDTNTTVSRETDLTSLSAEWESLDLEDKLRAGTVTPGNSDIAEELESLDEETKVQLLEQVIEKRLSRTTIQYTLRKCNGKWHRAVEELLSQIYLRETENSDDGGKLPSKGVDAFFEGNSVRSGRKGKSKRKNVKRLDERRSSSVPVSPVEPNTSTANAWQSSSQDIEFVASRTGLPSSTVATIYYKSGASRAKTVGAVLKQRLTEGTSAVAEDPIKAVTAHDLAEAFPSVAKEYVDTMIALTYPSTAAARELAEALTTRPVVKSGIDIIPTYARLSIDDEDEPHIGSSAGVGQRTSQLMIGDHTDSRERASTYAAARSAALAQAYAAHRKAKSDRLMGGVAAYYGQVSRDYYALSSGANAAAADELVATQSNSSQLDLHGVDVLNAVRIAQEKVEQWWQGLGESRANGRIGASERQSGYRIVVGLGRHSEGGRSKLGPAVRKMLTDKGWKNELNGAVITVYGRVRR